MAKTYNLFGVLNHSLLYVTWLLETTEETAKYKVSILDPSRKFKKGKIYLAPTVAAVQHFQDKLEKRKGVLIICDIPVALLELDNLKLLDGTQQPGATYRCRLFKLTRHRLSPVIKALDKPQPFKIKRQKLEVLPDLINRERSGKFLDKLNALIYFGVGTKEQHQIRNQVLKFLYERGSQKKLAAFLEETFTSTKGREYVKRLLDFFDTKPGIALRAATQEIGKLYRAKKQPSVKAIAKRHDADASELMYLGKIYNAKKTKNPLAVD